MLKLGIDNSLYDSTVAIALPNFDRCDVVLYNETLNINEMSVVYSSDSICDATLPGNEGH